MSDPEICSLIFDNTDFTVGENGVTHITPVSTAGALDTKWFAVWSGEELHAHCNVERLCAIEYFVEGDDEDESTVPEKWRWKE